MVIAFEGIDGTGKSTVSREVAKRMPHRHVPGKPIPGDPIWLSLSDVMKDESIFLASQRFDTEMEHEPIDNSVRADLVLSFMDDERRVVEDEVKRHSKAVKYGIDLIKSCTTGKFRNDVHKPSMLSYGYNIVFDSYMELARSVSKFLQSAEDMGIDVVLDRWIMSSFAYNASVKRTWVSQLIKYGKRYNYSRNNINYGDHIIFKVGKRAVTDLPQQDRYNAISGYLKEKVDGIYVPDVYIFMDEGVDTCLEAIDRRGERELHFENLDTLIRVADCYELIMGDTRRVRCSNVRGSDSDGADLLVPIFEMKSDAIKIHNALSRSIEENVNIIMEKLEGVETGVETNHECDA